MSDIFFGTDGWRGIIAKEFTYENLTIVTKAIALYIKTNCCNKPVLIGYDTRFDADEFALEVSNILNKMGFDTLISDKPVATPVMAFSAQRYESAGAIMITASHNKYNYCGVKYIPSYGGTATTDITDEIMNNVKLLKNGFIKINESEKKGKKEFFSPKEEYFENIKTFVNLDKLEKLNLKIAYDPLFGVGQDYFEPLLHDISNCKIESIHNVHDPIFGKVEPNTDEKYLKELKKFVLNNNFDLGLANDGDSARFGVIDEKGIFYTPNQIISMLLRHLVKNKGLSGSVIRTIATTNLLDALSEIYKTRIIETPVGFKYIAEEMRRTKTIIAGEESGGLTINGYIPEKDGILANLLVLEMLSYENKTLSEIWKDLTNEVGYEIFTKRLDLNLTINVSEISNLKSQNFIHIADLKVINIKIQDGIKFILEDEHSWVLVRPSGTEPIIRVYIESDSPEKLLKIENFMKDLIPQ